MYVLVELVNALDSFLHLKEGPSAVELNRRIRSGIIGIRPDTSFPAAQRGKSRSVGIQLCIRLFHSKLGAGQEIVSEAAMGLAGVGNSCGGS